MVLHIVCAVSVLRQLRLGLYSPTFFFAPPPLDHKVLEVIPSSLSILFITSIHQSAKQKTMLKWHIPYPSVLHWKEQSWEGMGSPQTGTYGTARWGMGCPPIQKKSDWPVPLVTLTGHLTIEQPLLLKSLRRPSALLMWEGWPQGEVLSCPATSNQVSYTTAP